VKNARESNIALWYKVLSITTGAYFHFKAGEAFREAQELLAKEESEKKERAAKEDSDKKKWTKEESIFWQFSNILIARGSSSWTFLVVFFVT